MNKFAKTILSAELLEAAADTVRSEALNRIRSNKDYHLACEDLWCDAKLLNKLTPAGDEILKVAEELAFMLERLI